MKAMDTPGKTYGRARDLRRRMTLPEVLLWQALRAGAIPGSRFRRQHPLGPYILDFYCPSARLAIEVDGWAHAMGDPDRDRRRDAWLEQAGVRTLRIEAKLVLDDMDAVLLMIAGACGAPL
jgi:very-short-patch-repair endonuclease